MKSKKPVDSSNFTDSEKANLELFSSLRTILLLFLIFVVLTFTALILYVVNPSCFDNSLVIEDVYADEFESVDDNYNLNSTEYTLTFNGGFGTYWGRMDYLYYYFNSSGKSTSCGGYNNSSSLTSTFDFSKPVYFSILTIPSKSVSSISPSVGEVERLGDFYYSFTCSNPTSTNITFTLSFVDNIVVIPDGYVLAEPGVEYGLCDYFIDTSVTSLTFDTPFYSVYTSYSLRPSFYSSFTAITSFNFAYSSSGYDRVFVTSSFDGGKTSFLTFSWYVGYTIPVSSSAYVYLTEDSVNNFLYVKSNVVEPVTADLSIDFQSSYPDLIIDSDFSAGIKSVNMYGADGATANTWSQSGVVQSVDFDIEDGVYEFYTERDAAALDRVTYSLASAPDSVLTATISNGLITCNCPLGDSISSMTIYTIPTIFYAPTVINFDSGIYKVTCGDLEWTETGQSNNLYYQLESATLPLTYSFDVYFNDSKTLGTVSFVADGLTASYSSSQLSDYVTNVSFSISEITAPQHFNSFSFTSSSMLDGSFNFYYPYYDGNTIEGFTSSYVSGGLVSVPGGTTFNSLQDIKSFLDDNYNDWHPAGSIIDVLNLNFDSVAFPIVINGQLLSLKFSEYSSKVAFVSSSEVGSDIYIVAFGFGGGAVYPTFPSDPVSDYYLNVPQFVTQTSRELFIYLSYLPYYGADGYIVEVFIDDIRYELPAVMVTSDEGYWLFTFDLSSLNLDNLYLNTVMSGLRQSYVCCSLYFSEIPGAFGWQPTINDSLSFFGDMMDGILEVLEIQVVRGMTFGTILLVVLAFGVLLFLFRMSGVF